MGEVVFYYSSGTVFYFPRSLNISSLYDWNTSRSSCGGGTFYELSKRKWARFAKKLLSTTSNWRTFILLCNLGKNGLCFLIKYSVVRYYQLSFNINSRHQTLSSKTWYFHNILCCLRQSRDLVQSSAKVHPARQLVLGTEIYSPYSISVTTSYSRSSQNLTTQCWRITVDVLSRLAGFLSATKGRFLTINWLTDSIYYEKRSHT